MVSVIFVLFQISEHGTLSCDFVFNSFLSITLEAVLSFSLSVCLFVVVVCLYVVVVVGFFMKGGGVGEGGGGGGGLAQLAGNSQCLAALGQCFNHTMSLFTKL